MKRSSLRAACALALLPLVLCAPTVSTADEDSPWPEGGSDAARIRAVRAVARDLEAKVMLMELSAARYANWESCLRGVPVTEYGDADRRFGFRYDERDGTPPGHLPALAVDRDRPPGREDFLFLDFSRGGGCSSDAPVPGGTADPAVAASAPRRPAETLGSLERRVVRLKHTVVRLAAAAERFDAWESCLSWVPVTEYGDPDRRFGYVFESSAARRSGFRPAIAIDRSDWDDPDYMFLAFVGGDRPGGTCRDEPGEAVD